MLLKFLFNLLLIYAVWQLIKIVFTINAVKRHVTKDFQQMQNHQQKNQHQNKADISHSNDKRHDDGEYVDFEEIK
ncbi:MAG: hypothetical protein H7321_00255 [Bacteroidia bacterium]|nr:hypothetical protein [Bacteroidia bacterium]